MARLPGVARPLRRPAYGRARESFRAVDKGLGQVGQAKVAVPGVVTQQVESMVHVQAEALGELALGLLDDDPLVGG